MKFCKFCIRGISMHAYTQVILKMYEKYFILLISFSFWNISIFFLNP